MLPFYYYLVALMWYYCFTSKMASNKYVFPGNCSNLISNTYNILSSTILWINNFHFHVMIVYVVWLVCLVILMNRLCQYMYVSLGKSFATMCFNIHFISFTHSPSSSSLVIPRICYMEMYFECVVIGCVLLEKV